MEKKKWCPLLDKECLKQSCAWYDYTECVMKKVSKIDKLHDIFLAVNRGY